MYKVYHVTPASYYEGFALIAANSAAEVNEHIAEYKANDPDNRWDSFGFTYVDEGDVIDNISSSIEGFVYNNIFYTGR